MQQKTFENGLAMLVLAFPNRTFDPKFIYDFTQDLSDEEIMNGVQKVVASSKEFYPGSNIIAYIREYAKVNKHISAGEAWGVVRQAISSVGSYGYPKFDDPMIGKAVAAVGWRDMCLSENPSIERAHFLKIYECLCNREREEMTYLPAPIVKNLIDNLGKDKDSHATP